PSQLYEAGLEGLLLGSLLWLAIRRGALKRPGRVIALFLIGYGLARTLIEGLRQADALFVTPDNPLWPRGPPGRRLGPDHGAGPVRRSSTRRGWRGCSSAPCSGSRSGAAR
ncbi:hypothetical protein CNY89_25555, partial [Amaricoccus sp. HAR-UPW-R2A-40]